VDTYVGLLRGINVGGHNQIKMAALRDMLGGLGHQDVVTYIQSGNVVFDTDGDPPDIVRSIETAIETEFGLDIAIALRTPGELAAAAEANPFLKEPPGPDRASATDPTAHRPDEFEIVGSEVHLHCPDGFGRSKLKNAWLEKELGVVSTIRGWNTVDRLLTLCRSRTS
jgi:uncharacterized protein (DUF1697 family)